MKNYIYLKGGMIVFLKFEWYEALYILFLMIIANICAIPYLLLLKHPLWYAKLLDRLFGQEMFMFDLYRD
ncbi:hypothetical protein BRE01_67480 [Brevibacillus reuszeri]|uniref:Uncharacterized protein n=1 Tax=Brevibacillus reuszeri TaxID=54915 RepID=A0A0K9YNE8_9BACL|nr:hypothetical protein ADS79_14600 [Brevibacillus reuszeri]GED73046.1 hypothetical protein BRE01_67480 [Brevibacillus reuszeri]